MARLVFGEAPKRAYDAKKFKVKHKNTWRQVSLLLQPSNKKWWEDPDVTVAFNLPRISSRLERLMGTNVVKLTDRQYMKQLRVNIDEDHRKQLLQRIKARELREIERERMLIIEGKTDIIPRELADDPIFIVNREASDEIGKERAKLKTSREKNAEHLKQQSVKWERERTLHAQREADLLWKRYERAQEQSIIVEQYKLEDIQRGMNLLRIENDDWRDCELDLRDFLINERIQMKERSLRVSRAFTSDPLDMQNVLRAKREKLEEKKKLKQQQEEELKEKEKEKLKEKEKEKDAPMLWKRSISRSIILPVDTLERKSILRDREQSRNFETDSFIERMRRRQLEDPITDMSEESVLSEDMSTISFAKARYASELQEEMTEEVRRGLLISQSQYDLLRYKNDRILSLRDARNMRELHRLAESFILGEVLEEEIFDLEGEEEDLEEEAEIEIFEPEPSLARQTV